MKRRLMKLIDSFSQRYSVRAYKPVPVEETKLKAVLEAMRLAPTACNLQPFQFIVIHTNGREDELRRIYRPSWFVQAPLIIGVCAQDDKAWSRRDGKNYADIDAAIAMDHLILAATEMDLGTCWVADFDPSAAKTVLELPENVEPVAFTPLGYSADTPKGKKRKTLAELVRYEKW